MTESIKVILLKTSVSPWVLTILLWNEERQKGVVSPFYREHSGFQATWYPSDTSKVAAPGGRRRNVVEGAPPWSAQSGFHSPNPTELKGSISVRKRKAQDRS